jgi:exodeoxyribonuclease V gamma subunit
MLELHRSERTDQLAAALCRLMSVPLPDPVCPEVVSVPTRGVERWLSQSLSERLGVCANVDFPFPGTLVGQATAAACGVGAKDDPWRPERSVWPLVEVIDDHTADPTLAPLIQHLQAATPKDRLGNPLPVRRLAMARHLADLFDRYATHRPEMVLSWTEGDGHDHWQAHLWKLLRQRIGVPSPAERLGPAVERLEAEPDLVDLPERLSIFGLTRLPASHLAILEAIAVERHVHLFLLHPSPALWSRIAGSSTRPRRGLPRSEDETAGAAENPLLRSWGRDAREMQVVLASHGVPDGDHEAVAESDSMLGRLQADIRADRPPSGAVPVDPNDDSLRIHACHGKARQVEVMRDAILHLLDQDATLEPRDVIVMCPDIEAFAPLVQAAFGIGTDEEVGARPRLRVRLADRSLRQTNPLLSVASQLLDLAGSRVTASQVVDLIARPPVGLRFGIDQDDLSTVERWIAGTGIRWGLDSSHRAPWALDRLDANTWSFGIDRLSLGVAMTEPGCRVFEGVVPYDDVSSAELELAGKLSELLNRLSQAISKLQGKKPLTAWLTALAAGTESLAASPADGEWQLDQLHSTLGGVGEEAAGTDPEVCLDEIRVLLADRLKGRPTRANFRTGDLTVCTLVPMRSVPHRVVCLLGLDDGAFPRHTEQDGDDLLLASPRVGDRDGRGEDRQLLLDALMAATDHLVVTFSGRDERTNRPKPPCVPVAELLDVIDSTFSTDDSGPARRHVLVRHPLQPFDARNFSAGEMAGAGPWGYDRVFLEGARALSTQRPAGAWLGAPLPALEEPVVQLEQLVRFVQNPVRQFLRQRLNLYLSDRQDELVDSLPVELDALERWQIGDRLLESCLAGVDIQTAVEAERRRGLLPPGDLAEPVLSAVQPEVEELVEMLDRSGFLGGFTSSREVAITLQDGRTLIGAVPAVRDHTIISCVFSRLAPKHRLAAWVRLLALCADGSGNGTRAVTVGRGRAGDPVAMVAAGPVSTPEALAQLTLLTDLYQRGMRSPLPMVCDGSAAWAKARREGCSEEDALLRLEREWKKDDPDLAYVHGRDPSLIAVYSEKPWPDEAGPGWDDREPTRFGRLAMRLWSSLLDHETWGVLA